MSNEQAPSQSGQKPMLHSQRVKQQRAEHEKVTGKQAPPQKTIYFPLGYKDAAYQWVCHVTLDSLPTPSECPGWTSAIRHRLLTPGIVDKR